MEGLRPVGGFEPSPWAIREENEIRGVLVDSFPTKYGTAYNIRLMKPCRAILENEEIECDAGETVALKETAWTKRGLAQALALKKRGNFVVVDVVLGKKITSGPDRGIPGEVQAGDFPLEKYAEITGLGGRGNSDDNADHGNDDNADHGNVDDDIPF